MFPATSFWYWTWSRGKNRLGTASVFNASAARYDSLPPFSAILPAPQFILFCTVCPYKCLAVSGSLNVKIFSCIYMYIYIYIHNSINNLTNVKVLKKLGAPSPRFFLDVPMNCLHLMVQIRKILQRLEFEGVSCGFCPGMPRWARNDIGGASRGWLSAILVIHLSIPRSSIV